MQAKYEQVRYVFQDIENKEFFLIVLIAPCITRKIKKAKKERKAISIHLGLFSYIS